MKFLVLIPFVFLILSVFLWKLTFFRKIIFPLVWGILLAYAGGILIFTSKFIRGGNRYIQPDSDWYWIVFTAHKLFGIILLLLGTAFIVSVCYKIYTRNYKQNESQESNEKTELA